MKITLTDSELNLIKVSAQNGIDFLHYSIDLLSERYECDNYADIYDAYLMQTINN